MNMLYRTISYLNGEDASCGLGLVFYRDDGSIERIQDLGFYAVCPEEMRNMLAEALIQSSNSPIVRHDEVTHVPQSL